MNLREDTELRKLPAGFNLTLARLLQDNDTWKILMSNIPETLDKHSYDCKITKNNPAKYSSVDISLIEHNVLTTRRLPLIIILDEWGTSGRIRPKLGHLFSLLQECQLYGAADYIAKILKREAPQRPISGPAAKVDLTPSERIQIQDTAIDIREILDVMDYPSYNLEQNNFNNPAANNIGVQSISDVIVNYPLDTFADNQQNSNSNGVRNTDLIQFSSDIPPISDLLRSDSNNIQSIDNDSVQSGIPPLSALLNDSLPSVLKHNSNLPNVSLFNNTTTDNSTLNGNSNTNSNLPDFNAFQSQSSIHSQNISIPRRHDSPLPSLSLHTELRHYSYTRLEVATNNFNENPYIHSCLQEPNLSEGRFLGSGAFGSVYLAFGILDKPVAVKRIDLKNLKIQADDFITRQFITEVETLYRYRHKNLLSALGYSCDGMSYCLLYEYVQGGNLKDRLQNMSNILKWEERLDIAVGITKAVAYLHTAYSTPLIHRDIKSANILLDADNQPKLCDFGIIRISSGATTNTAQISGTSAYMSPEASRGDVSVKMDTYSFGVVLLELLTGLPPVNYDRDAYDLVTHIQDYLEDETDITPLIDAKAGTWIESDINFAQELYKISQKCLQHKRIIRPTMVNVRDELLELVLKRIEQM